jgi:cold shock CspA family protein
MGSRKFEAPLRRAKGTTGMRLQGTVSTFITHKKFGFIHYSEGAGGEIFFHELDVIDGDVPQRTDRVEFDLGMYKGRQKAVNVKRISNKEVRS